MVTLAFASCQQNTAKTIDAVTESTSVTPSPDAPIITFETENYNFGKIAHGEKVSYSYKFKNTGKSPLIIANATATCGCTIPEPPKDPIKPGEEGEIKVIFDSKGKSGMQDKVITVTSNANPTQTDLHLTGEII